MSPTRPNTEARISEFWVDNPPQLVRKPGVRLAVGRALLFVECSIISIPIKLTETALESRPGTERETIFFMSSFEKAKFWFAVVWRTTIEEVGEAELSINFDRTIARTSITAGRAAISRSTSRDRAASRRAAVI